MGVILESVPTCPHCGLAWRERMPMDACQCYDVSPSCHTRLHQKPSDCSVFCSYGSVSYPPVYHTVLHV